MSLDFTLPAQQSTMDEARRQIEICNACRYCEGFCSVFPAMTRNKVFATGDLTHLANLCHNCRGCYYACQYTAPHEFALNIPAALAVVRNEYGGGGTRGANLFTAQARPDGRMVLGTSGSTQIAYLLGDLRVRYDYDDWDVLMATPMGGVVYVSADLGIGSWHEIADLQGQRLLYASMGPASLDLVPMLAFRLLGLDVRYVFGYAGRHDGLRAMQQGEVSIDYQTTPGYLANVAPQVAQGRAVPLMTWGVLDADGRVLRDPTFPDLPTVEEIYELLHGAPPSGPDYEAYRAFATAGFAAQKMLVLPRETPGTIQDEWIGAIRKVLADPDYLAEAPARLGAYQTVVGEDAAHLARSAMHIDPAVRQNVLDMLASEYAVRLSE